MEHSKAFTLENGWKIAGMTHIIGFYLEVMHLEKKKSLLKRES